MYVWTYVGCMALESFAMEHEEIKRIVGKSGGVVQNLTTGRETPFHRTNGIYVLGMWQKNSEDSGFAGR